MIGLNKLLVEFGRINDCTAFVASNSILVVSIVYPKVWRQFQTFLEGPIFNYIELVTVPTVIYNLFDLLNKDPSI